MDLKGKVILITGGTGSLGRKLAEVLLRDHDPHSVRIFSRDELKQSQMREDFHDDQRLRFLIGDVRDAGRLNRAMDGVHVVIHAAALKQIVAAEYNPIEAVKTNILGAVNVIDAAIDRGVEKVVGVSTDKAVYPINLYGATKLAAEKLFVHGNAYSGSRGTRFSCVRYGNVVGSRGSIVPLFERLKSSGKLPITDPRMTRFWITLDQAVELILTCIREMKGGEIFVPKIPSMKVTDLAQALAPEAEWNVVGIRPGEKLKEYLISSEEARYTRDCGSYYAIEPTNYPFWAGNGKPVAKGLGDGFEYNSENNEEWLTAEELRDVLGHA
jgi:UDP-N-acetylglucosamine 4,6-dehydratase